MMSTIYNKVKRFLDKYRMIDRDDLVAVGVSGGADSVCLLHLLCLLREEADFRMLVVHVDHGVRADSAEDASYVEALCEKLGVPFYLRKVDMDGYAAVHKLSSEEAGRVLRYTAFEEVLREQSKEGQSCKIAVAHNCNDRAETMLFHMFRGSGIRGLASIWPVNGAVIRPLLCLERKEIEEYLALNGLRYCHDSTNEEDSYTRNRIRHHILPYAEKEICTSAITHMGELAEILSETECYLEGQTRRLYTIYVKENTDGQEHNADKQPGETVSLCIDKGLLVEDPVLYKRVLLTCLERLTPYRKDITGRHIASLVQLLEKDGSKEIRLPYGIRAYKEYDRLYLGRDTKETAEPVKSGKPEGASAVHRMTSREVVSDSCQVYEIVPPMEIRLPEEGRFSFHLIEKGAGILQKEQNIPQNRYTKWFDYDKITTSLLLRKRQPGDYLTIDAAMHTKSVKQYMINEKIPKMRRDSMHLLADGSHVLWIPGYRISQKYKVEENTERILEVRLEGGSDGGTNRSVVE